MQSDTASLYVHRDVDSLMTYPGTSISSSKRSIEFEFDAELFMSRIYKRWMKGLVKKTLHEQQSETPFSPRLSPRSQAIDNNLRMDAKRLQCECKILLLGSESRGEIARMFQCYAGLCQDELLKYRLAVFENVCESAKALVDAMRQYEVAPESDTIWGHVDFIMAFIPESGLALDPRFKTAIEAILGSPHYSEVMERCTEFYLPDIAE
uniref:Genomic scaffold, CS5907_Ctg0257 n=1 Tax=Fusarium acuminatum CS5907 TaxID=1318461 RepID=A0A096PEX2_9HYPO|nr:unnamed protein product [Fusarium acuminatum CS5907]